jgi:hypothetical protein
LTLDGDAVRGLSREARDGFGFAIELAKRDLQRREAALHGDPMPSASLEEFALNAGCSASTIRRRIATARRELFGDLSDAGIYYRRRRNRSRAAVRQAARFCEAPGCGNPLPETSTVRRKYCSGSRCRTAAYRARRSA